MSSTFMGLEISKRGMAAQQTALYVTSQNVANANTPGYSRQRVDFEQTEPYPGPGLNRPQIPGQMGTGVKAGSIQRIRESYLDQQYRTENNQVGYYQSQSDALDQLQSIMNEPSDSGLSTTMDQFWQSLQDLAADPTNSGARSVVRQRGEAVADTLNYLSNSITVVQKDKQGEIDKTASDINSTLKQLNEVNKQIGRVEPNGLLPNDLYDERDRLIDQLSSMVNIKVLPSQNKPNGNPDPNAEGMVTIDLVDASGNSLGNLLSDTGTYNEVRVKYDGTNGPAKEIKLVDPNTADDSSIPGIDFSKMTSSGQLLGQIQAYGYETTDSNGTVTVNGTYPDMLNKLDNLAYTFASQFNEVQMSGVSAYDLDPNNTPEKTPFFTDDNNIAITGTTNKAGLAGKIKVSNEIQQNLDKIATATSTNPNNADPSVPKDITGATLGDSSNAYNLANVIKTAYAYGSSGDKADFQGYYQSVIGQMGVDAQESQRMATNSTSLQQSVDQRRQSVSSVSLDEEMTNMIQFQHAYSASARMINLQDQMLDTIINGMGVGR